ncbi:restriction endonuclease [Frederiksenia canicola]
MELQFEQLDYQQAAVQAVINLFDGQPNADLAFDLKMLNDVRFIANAALQLSDEQLQQNLTAQQTATQISPSFLAEQGKHFSIEMETGTGKTYVYLRTIFELNRSYGWQKFVIVVPSVAIREGVLHSLTVMKSHFDDLFNKPSVNPAFEYKSQQLNRLRAFATNNVLEILVMNIDAFAKDSNVINTPNESGDAPIRYIQQANPIVIIDEPQNMETALRRQAIESLNPLFTLRYSATHKFSYNLIYQLNPVQAYEMGLVKQIEVDSVLTENEINGAYLALKELKTTAKSWSAKIELLYNDPKAMKKKVVTVKPTQDLFECSNQNEMYQNGFLLSGMDSDQQMVEFANGTQLFCGVDHSLLQDERQKMQIRRTITEHLQKEQKLQPLGIKVLSLFFIDKVEHYRGLDGSQGKFAQWFEEIYRELTSKAPNGVHNGYFSQDKKGVAKNTNGTTQADNDTYQLIMRDKESLLSLDNPLRFIFSHSALREGWDNPNVFQICTLNDTASEIKKRQEIGRGLRLPVNQQGVRNYDRSQNILTVIANESYDEFAAKLQREIEEDCGVTFDKSHIKKREDKQSVRYRKNLNLHPEFAAIWERIKQQTTYRVLFSQANVIKQAVDFLQKMPKVQATKIKHHKVRLSLTETGVQTEYRSAHETQSQIQWAIPDLLNALQQKTGLTRQTLCKILQQSDRLQEVANNPQRFIDLAAEQINRALQQILLDGVQYRCLDGKHYAMSLFHDFEFYINSYTFAVQNTDKTIYDGYLPLDSMTEHTFAQECESSEEVAFYFKLPEKFKIPTPLGYYNPDWAVVFNGQHKLYFVVETKNAKGIQCGVDENVLRETERLKIAYARKNFQTLAEQQPDLAYDVVERVSELSKLR